MIENVTRLKTTTNRNNGLDKTCFLFAHQVKLTFALLITNKSLLFTGSCLFVIFFLLFRPAQSIPVNTKRGKLALFDVTKGTDTSLIGSSSRPENTSRPHPARCWLRPLTLPRLLSPIQICGRANKASVFSWRL